MTDPKQKKPTDQKLEPFSETRDPRVNVYKRYIERQVRVLVRHAGKDQDYYVEGKLVDVIEYPGADSTLVIENKNGPQLVPFNTIRPGKFTLLETDKK